MRRLIVAALFPSLLAGCLATAPLSFIEGHPDGMVDRLDFPVRVVSVDGNIEFRHPVQLSPGVRMLVLASPNESVRGPVQKSYAFKVEPCSRYHFVGRRKSPMEHDWTLVVQARHAVPGCDPREEIDKARKAGLMP